MLTQPRISFLQEKIMDLQQALFFDLGSSVLKLPTSVIQALHVDEVGQVWFFLARPAQHVNEFEREFRSKLDFYRKGKSFYIHLVGKACIVSDPEEMYCISWLTEEHRQLANDKMILVKLKITDTYYYPVRQPISVPKQETVRGGVHTSAFIKTLQYIVKDIIPVFQSH